MGKIKLRIEFIDKSTNKFIRYLKEGNNLEILTMVDQYYAKIVENGNSTLHLAINQCNILVIEELLKYVNVNVLNYEKQTPLHLACSREPHRPIDDLQGEQSELIDDSLEIVSLLVSKNSNVNAADINV